MTGLWSVLIAYLLGSIPPGYLLVRLLRGVDVRESGSGSIGATNVARVAGFASGVAAFLADAGKAFLAVWLAGLISGQSPAWMSLAAVAAVAGNVFPIFLEFRGGKGMAAFIGAFLYLMPVPTAAVVLLFVVMVAVYRHVSVGSILAAGTFPLAVWLIEHPPRSVLAASLLAAGLVLWRHMDDFRRLKDGTEHRLTWP